MTLSKRIISTFQLFNFSTLPGVSPCMNYTWDSLKAGHFVSALLGWKDRNPRPLPWKGIKDPYLIWLSEVILQQTRVEQGLPYFERFQKRFPDIISLAAAPDDEVYKLWEGLGYYSRARNMLETARLVAGTYGGKFPDTYEGLRALKGVGPYTAAAIASFAFDLPHAVVDGNVYRVLARVFGIATPSDTGAGKRLFGGYAQALLDGQNPGVYNQAIMDFGALHCKPAAPLCGSCPMQAFCSAYREGKVEEWPVKAKRKARKVRYFHYLVLNYRGKLLIRKRAAKDIWQNLYDFPMIESGQSELEVGQIGDNPVWEELFGRKKFRSFKRSRPFLQSLTHQQIIACFWEFELESPWKSDQSAYLEVDRENLSKFAFPKIVDWYLNDNSLYLEL